MFGLDTNPGYDICTEKITRKSLHIGIYHQVIIEDSHLIEAILNSVQRHERMKSKQNRMINDVAFDFINKRKFPMFWVIRKCYFNFCNTCKTCNAISFLFSFN